MLELLVVWKYWLLHDTDMLLPHFSIPMEVYKIVSVFQQLCYRQSKTILIVLYKTKKNYKTKTGFFKLFGAKDPLQGRNFPS